MRQLAFLLGVAVFFAGAAGAQSKFDNTSAADPSVASDGAVSDARAPQLFATAADPSGATADASSSAAPSAPSPSAAGSALPQDTSKLPGVQSVFAQYNWQAYLGYTFLHFNVAPSYSKNTNGFNLAIEYYPHTGAFGVDAESIVTFASVEGQLGRLWTGMGGGRYRFAGPRGLEIWGHGLLGGAKFVPQTPFGSQTGFAYDLGAGVDVAGFNHRLGFRFAGDMVGTRFFGTGQYSPEVSAGIVFKY
jgi:hypothetical protein